MNYSELIKQFVVMELLSDEEFKNIDYNESLLETGIIDSVGIMKLVVFLEDKFGINIEETDIIPDNFENIEAISSFVSIKNTP